jgi:hypothetical protein
MALCKDTFRNEISSHISCILVYFLIGSKVDLMRSEAFYIYISHARTLMLLNTLETNERRVRRESAQIQASEL